MVKTRMPEIWFIASFNKTSLTAAEQTEIENQRKEGRKTENKGEKWKSLPWASGRLKTLPGDTPIVVCTGFEPEKKVRPKRIKKCECKHEVIKKRDPFEYCYPEYVDLCDTCLVNEELIFFLNLIAVGDRHYEKELERNKQADKEAKKQRQECIKRKKEAGQDVSESEEEDEETEDEGEEEAEEEGNEEENDEE